LQKIWISYKGLSSTTVHNIIYILINIFFFFFYYLRQNLVTNEQISNTAVKYNHMIRISLSNYVKYILPSVNFFFLIYLRLVLTFNYETILIKICIACIRENWVHSKLGRYPIRILEFCPREIDEQYSSFISRKQNSKICLGHWVKWVI